MRQIALAAGILGQAMLLTLWMAGDAPSNEGMATPPAGGTLTVLTLTGPTSYRLDREGTEVGPEVERVQAFARSHGWKVQWLVADSKEDLLERLADGQAHFAAAGMALLKSRDANFLMGRAHSRVNEQLVCHFKMRPFPSKLRDLNEIEIDVEKGSAFVETLHRLAGKHQLSLQVNQREDLLAAELMREVEDQDIDCMVSDSDQIKALQRLYPDLKVAMNLTKGLELGWYFSKSGEPMKALADQWMGSKAGKAELARIKRNHIDYIAKFDFVEMQVLNRRIRDRLPKYRKLFLQAEKETGIPADLLAAVAYQESHWNPNAKSATGVRGIMMLTQRTARSLGVNNRLDARESIEAGARYLKDRYEKQPTEIPDPDRLYFALASYNVGHAHLMDTRYLARKLGRNPNSWEEIRKVLPLKADRKYYRKMRYGYARGYEPVRYVRRIRNYRDVIQTAFVDD